MEVIAGAACAFAGFYVVYRLLAAVVGFGARLLRIPHAPLFSIGLTLAASGLAAMGWAYATVGSCERDATFPFLGATAALMLALAISRNLSEEKAGRAVQLPALAGMLAWPVVAVLGLAIARRSRRSP